MSLALLRSAPLVIDDSAVRCASRAAELRLELRFFERVPAATYRVRRSDRDQRQEGTVEAIGVHGRLG